MERARPTRRSLTQTLAASLDGASGSSAKQSFVTINKKKIAKKESMARLLLVCACMTLQQYALWKSGKFRTELASEQDGDARVFMDATEVVFVRMHPKVVRRQYLDGLVKQADMLIQLALAHEDQEMNLYIEWFARIKRSSRQKRNILGDGLRWLAGSATLEDVQMVCNSFVGLDDQLQQQEIAIRDTVACVQMDREEITAIAAKTSELINVMNS